MNYFEVLLESCKQPEDRLPNPGCKDGVKQLQIRCSLSRLVARTSVRSGVTQNCNILSDASYLFRYDSMRNSSIFLNKFVDFACSNRGLRWQASRQWLVFRVETFINVPWFSYPKTHSTYVHSIFTIKTQKLPVNSDESFIFLRQKRNYRSLFDILWHEKKKSHPFWSWCKENLCVYQAVHRGKLKLTC